MTIGSNAHLTIRHFVSKLPTGGLKEPTLLKTILFAKQLRECIDPFNVSCIAWFAFSPVFPQRRFHNPRRPHRRADLRARKTPWRFRSSSSRLIRHSISSETPRISAAIWPAMASRSSRTCSLTIPRFFSAGSTRAATISATGLICRSRLTPKSFSAGMAGPFRSSINWRTAATPPIS